MIVFVALLLILRKMAWKPIVSSIEEREKTIKDSLDQAAKIQSESLRITEEQNRILAQARSEANTLLQTTRQAGEELKRKLEQSAVDMGAVLNDCVDMLAYGLRTAGITVERKLAPDLPRTQQTAWWVMAAQQAPTRLVEP